MKIKRWEWIGIREWVKKAGWKGNYQGQLKTIPLLLPTLVKEQQMLIPAAIRTSDASIEKA